MIISGEGSIPATPAQITNNNNTGDQFNQVTQTTAPGYDFTGMFDNSYIAYGAIAVGLLLLFFMTKKK